MGGDEPYRGGVYVYEGVPEPCGVGVLLPGLGGLLLRRRRR